jgi:hypothetical protein
MKSTSTYATPAATPPHPKHHANLSCGSLSPEKMPSTIDFDRLEIMVVCARVCVCV